MGQSSGIRRDLFARETLLALLVLALAFLNFGQTTAVFAAGGRVVVTGTSICGDHDPTAAGDHFICHACRSGDAAALPPPPATIAPVCFAVMPVVYAPALPALSDPLLVRTGNPRAPPIA